MGVGDIYALSHEVLSYSNSVILLFKMYCYPKTGILSSHSCEIPVEKRG